MALYSGVYRYVLRGDASKMEPKRYSTAARASTSSSSRRRARVARPPPAVAPPPINA